MDRWDRSNQARADRDRRVGVVEDRAAGWGLVAGFLVAPVVGALAARTTWWVSLALVVVATVAASLGVTLVLRRRGGAPT